MISIYVDDLLIVGPNMNDINALKQTLHSEFEMTDLGEAHWILGIEIQRNKDCEILINQKLYANTILKRFQMEDCNPVQTPLDTSVVLIKSQDDEEIDEYQTMVYQQIIGSVMYLMLGTRPDLAYSITMLSQFNAKPNSSHLQAAKRLLRYIQRTKCLGLYYPSNKNTKIIGFVDSSYASSIYDRKSFCGYIFQYGSATISWTSSKQQTVALSTTEAEYMALTLAAKQALWIKTFLNELQRPKEIKIFGDNQAAIFLAKNAGLHKRSKHIDIQYHFIREKLQNKEFQLEFCTSSENLADIVTKGLARITTSKIIRKLNIKDVSEGDY